MRRDSLGEAARSGLGFLQCAVFEKNEMGWACGAYG